MTKEDEENNSRSQAGDGDAMEVEEAITHAKHKENGNSAYKTKDYREAISHYTLAIETAKSQIESDSEKAAEITPFLASYYSNRAAAFTMLLKYDDALSDCDSALSIDTNFVKAYFRKGKILTTKGQLDDALKAYTLGMIRDPNNASAIKEKDEVTRCKKRFETAKDLLGEIKDGDRRAKCTRTARKAFVEIGSVLALCPEWKDAILVKAECLLYMNKVNEAYPLTTRLLRLGMGQNSILLLLRCNCLLRMGQLDDAVKHLRQILSGDPDNKKAFALLKTLKKLGKKKEEADTAYKGKRFDDAVALYSEAIDICPPEDKATIYRAKLYFNRATANANRRQHEEVVKDCTEAISLEDEYIKAYMRRAASYLIIGGVGECDKGIRDYERAKELTSSEEQEEDIDKKIRSARVQAKRAKRKDLYKILDVNRDAGESEIKKKYRKSALKWHPDRHANSTEEEKKKAEEIFRDVNLAYEVLSDPAKKQRYDDGVDEQDLDNPDARPPGEGGFGHGPGGIDPNVLFQMFMQQQQGGGGGGMGGRERTRSRGSHNYHFG